MDEREAVDRLRAADPAAGRLPDEERLASLVEARRAGASGEARADDELAARRSRRLRPVAAAVVAALAVGATGYAVGRTVDDAPPAAEPVLGRTLEGARTDSAVPEMAAPTIGHVGGGRMSFTSSGLSSAGGSAQAWAFDGAGAYDEETVTRAAEVLGVAGEPRQEEAGAGWSVGSNDGSTAFLHLMPDGMATVSYYDPELQSFLDEDPPVPLPAPEGRPDSAPGGGGVDNTPGTAADGAVEILPAEPGAPPADGEPADPGTPDDEPTAVEPDGTAPDGPAGVLYETLTALGIDPEAAEYETGDHWAGDQVSLVTAHLVVDGERAGAAWQAEVVEDTVYSFSGPLAPVATLGDYDVIGPAQAVERLSDPRFGHSDYRLAAGTGPVPDPAMVRPWGTPPADPPAPGTAVPWPVRDVTITGAELTLTTTTTEDGVTLVLPTYSLSDSDGGTWTVVALAEHELAF